MYDAQFKGIPWQRFRDFISPQAMRFDLLKELLTEAALDYSILELAGGRHFIIAPASPEESYLRSRPVILLAHYDRAEGSPGANDNSAGVFLLLETAVKLNKKNTKNWLIILTDNEEIKTGDSIQNQGAFALAARLKSLKVENPQVYSFDACGTGDTLIISTTAEYLLKKEGGSEKFRDSFLELRTNALTAARNLGMSKVLLSPTPFSDDAGFFRAGLAAQTITMLPQAESMTLVSELRRNPEFAEALINAESRDAGPVKAIPETWRCLNGPGDSYLRLTPGNFRIVVRFAEALCTG